MKDLSLETWVSPTLMRKKRELLALSWSSASAWKTLKTNGLRINIFCHEWKWEIIIHKSHWQVMCDRCSMFIHILKKKKKRRGPFQSGQWPLAPPYFPLSLNKWGACISGFGFNPKEVIVNHKTNLLLEILVPFD